VKIEMVIPIIIFNEMHYKVNCDVTRLIFKNVFQIIAILRCHYYFC
jgi:hypothetical protein